MVSGGFRAVFIFCFGGPRPPDPGGGDPLSERSKTLRPENTSTEVSNNKADDVRRFIQRLALIRARKRVTECARSVWSMEYLGDSTLSAAVTDLLFAKYPLSDEGIQPSQRLLHGPLRSILS